MLIVIGLAAVALIVSAPVTARTSLTAPSADPLTVAWLSDEYSKAKVVPVPMVNAPVESLPTLLPGATTVPVFSVTAPGTVPDPPMVEPALLTTTAPVPVPVPLNRTVPALIWNVEPAPRLVAPLMTIVPAPALTAVNPAVAGVMTPPERVNVWLVPTVTVLPVSPAKVIWPA